MCGLRGMWRGRGVGAEVVVVREGGDGCGWMGGMWKLRMGVVICGG